MNGTLWSENGTLNGLNGTSLVWELKDSSRKRNGTFDVVFRMLVLNQIYHEKFNVEDKDTDDHN